MTFGCVADQKKHYNGGTSLGIDYREAPEYGKGLSCDKSRVALDQSRRTPRIFVEVVA